ncbi:TIGR03084 family metal-binding protein [Actinophytocola sp.]|uniref:TIGR03084 family metal-binding protein n=1 Tax=Actinophytocola sp. TaxID=1872138 RepID=UPI002EDA4EF6
MAVSIDELLDDVTAETAVVDRMLDPLSPREWELATPAAGWAIRDQVGHLAYFDETVALAVTDEAAFRTCAAEAMARGTDFANEIAKDYRTMPAGELLTWFRKARAAMLSTFHAADPARKVPWYGPSMSLASSITARLMETWAHGQDIADALGVTRAPTVRLRHIAHLGVRTLPFSFTVRGLPVPDRPVRVELTAPDGDTWTWGSGADSVTGDALDFCLVVTQRRNVADTGLRVAGPVATEWMAVAQAFAGPPGPGRPVT